MLERIGNRSGPPDQPQNVAAKSSCQSNTGRVKWPAACRFASRRLRRPARGRGLGPGGRNDGPDEKIRLERHDGRLSRLPPAVLRIVPVLSGGITAQGGLRG